LLVFVVLAIVFAAIRGPEGSGLPAEATVLRAIDGDTLEIASGGKTYHVRLIGVDCPESRPNDKLDRDARRSKQDTKTIMALGKRATTFTRDLVEGRSCRLEYDAANRTRDHRDRYRRLLAFVWVGDVLLNAEIIREGYGQALTRYEFDPTRQAEFRALERAAREQQRGLWGDWKP